MTPLSVRRLGGTSEVVTHDGELFARVEAGDLGALGELFDRHHVSVRSFLARVSSSGNGDIDDLVQETCLTASRATPSLRG